MSEERIAITWSGYEPPIIIDPAKDMVGMGDWQHVFSAPRQLYEDIQAYMREGARISDALRDCPRYKRVHAVRLYLDDEVIATVDLERPKPISGTLAKGPVEIPVPSTRAEDDPIFVPPPKEQP
jgi:hypothetical protein